MSEAGTVAEAVAALAAEPDWVLLDLMLPDGCGFEVYRRAAVASPASRFCVVTGCGPALAEAARELGIGRVMTKPVDVDRLTGILRANGDDGRRPQLSEAGRVVKPG